MKFQIGQVTIQLLNDGIRVSGPVAENEIAVKIRYAPEDQNPFVVSFSVWKGQGDKPDAQ